MALKATVTAEEHTALAEPIKALYVASQDGKAFVLDADVDNHPSVTGLKNTVNATRLEREDAKKALQELKTQFGDLDPAKAREALAKIQKLEEKNLIDEGKIEELFAKRIEGHRKDSEAQINGLKKIVKEREDEIGSLKTSLSSALIDTGLRMAAAKGGVRAAAIDDVLLRGSRVWKLRDGKPHPYRDDGTTTLFGKDANNPMSMEEWVTSLMNDAPHLFETNTGGRTEPSVNRVSGGGKAVTLTREQARDPHVWRAARDRATKEGAELVVQD